MNPCPLISPERVNEILAHMPPRDGRIWGNDEQHIAARIVFTFLLECGIGLPDMRGIAMTLARIAT